MEEPPYARGVTPAAGLPVDHALSVTCRGVPKLERRVHAAFLS
jgi:hypothetical protein